MWEALLQDREQRKDGQLREVSKEVVQLRTELGRMEGLNNILQGYGLDDMSDKALGDLVAQMTQVNKTSSVREAVMITLELANFVDTL